jgi:hypothetical protein
MVGPGDKPQTPTTGVAPLAWSLTGGNRNDVTQLIPLVERVPPVLGKVEGREGRAEIHEAFLALGCCLVCCRRLRASV